MSTIKAQTISYELLPLDRSPSGNCYYPSKSPSSPPFRNQDALPVIEAVTLDLQTSEWFPAEKAGGFRKVVPFRSVERIIEFQGSEDLARRNALRAYQKQTTGYPPYRTTAWKINLVA